MKSFTNYPVLTLILSLLPFLLAAQYAKPHRQFRPGDTELMLGFGLLPTFVKDRTRQELPPVSLGLAYRIARNYSLTVEVSHSVATSERPDLTAEGRQYRNSAYYFSVRNAVHCNCDRIPEWDIYGGMAFTYFLTRLEVVDGTFGQLEKRYGIRSRRDQFTYSGFLGARYACSARLSFLGEVGYGISILRLGVGYKL